MKNVLILIFIFFSNFCFLQTIEYSNFNSEILNRKILNEINRLRKGRGLDTLVTSTSVFNIYAKPNCVEVAKSDRLYHPQVDERFKNPFLRDLIVNEFKNVYGGESLLLSSGMPKMDLNENCFKSNHVYDNYDILAVRAVDAWEKSEGHKYVQNLKYSSSNKPGVFACHSVMNEDGMIYIFVDYVKIYRVE